MAHKEVPVMKKKYVVTLTADEIMSLKQLLKKAKLPARKLQRAHILLLAHEGHTDAFIAKALHVGTATVERTRQKFVDGGVEWALTERPRPGAARKLDGKAEAFLVATACSAPPAGRDEWTMQLLADRLVAVGLVEEISDETVRRTLKKTRSSPGLRSSGASQR
jgi:transposase